MITVLKKLLPPKATIGVIETVDRLADLFSLDVIYTGSKGKISAT